MKQESESVADAAQGAIAFVLLGTVWILLTDRLLPILFTENLDLLQTLKDLLFVLLGGGFFYLWIRDVTAGDEEEAELLEDPLTGLPNRALLAEHAESAFARAARHGHHVGVVYLGLNRFTRINETLGHDAGDQILVQTGRRLKGTLRHSDAVARIGGDEFVVLVCDVQSEEEVLTAARRIRDVFEVPFFAADRSVHVDARFGVSVYPGHGVVLDKLLARAERAMGLAADRSSEIVMFDPSRDASREELVLEEELREALENEELELHFQPVRDLDSGVMIGAEALARWRRPEGELRRPGQFIPLAERTGLVRKLDRWAVEEALEDAEELFGAGLVDWVGVNLSAQSLMDREWTRELCELLAESGAEPGRLVLEITESTAMEDPERAAEAFRQLRELGVKLAIDDFGTGHSALAYLKSFPFDLLKVDMIFVRDVDEDAQAAGLLRAIVQLGRAVNVSVIAEGLESHEERKEVARLGCRYGQGHVLGRPVPVSDLVSSSVRASGVEASTGS